MALEVWWNSEDEKPTRVESSVELLALLEMGRNGADYPIMFEIVDPEDPYQGSILDVGFTGELGALYFSGPQAERGCYSYSAATTAEGGSAQRVYFDHMNHTRDFPPNSLCPIDVVLRAVVEFADSNGSIPGTVEWQPASVMSAD